jgi:hypothetical protein
MMWWRWDDEASCWQPTLVPPTGPFEVSRGARLIPVRSGRRWALLADSTARVNGLPCLPLEVLDDRDEIRVSGEHFVFSTHSPPEVVSVTDSTRKMRCARCLGGLVEGDPIVRCPNCRAHHHASCWTYDVRCQKCSCPADGAPWVPPPLN